MPTSVSRVNRSLRRLAGTATSIFGNMFPAPWTKLHKNGKVKEFYDLVVSHVQQYLYGSSVLHGTVIDTPGFDDTTKSDMDILRMIASFLVTQ